MAPVFNDGLQIISRFTEADLLVIDARDGSGSYVTLEFGRRKEYGINIILLVDVGDVLNLSSSLVSSKSETISEVA